MCSKRHSAIKDFGNQEVYPFFPRICGIQNPQGAHEGLGLCRVIVPSSIVEDMWHGNYTVLFNKQSIQFRNWTAAENTYVYSTCQHSEHEVTIVAEFPSPVEHVNAT